MTAATVADVGARATDDLLYGLKIRDFVVLALHAAGEDPRSLRNVIRLRRGRWFVRHAEQRLAARELLDVTGDKPTLTPDGTRALRTGAVLLELESFDASV